METGVDLYLRVGTAMKHEHIMENAALVLPFVLKLRCLIEMRQFVWPANGGNHPTHVNSSLLCVILLIYNDTGQLV